MDYADFEMDAFRFLLEIVNAFPILPLVNVTFSSSGMLLS